MEFILDKEEFARAFERLRGLVSVDGPLSRQSIQDDFSSFRFISFSSVFNRTFFRAMKQFCRGVDDDSFLMVATDPDPRVYVREFGRYNAVSCSVGDSADSYIEMLNDGPKGSSADSIVDSSNRLFFFSHSRSWLFFGDRYANPTCCCFVNRSVAEIFESSYGGDLFPSILDATKFSQTTGEVAASLSSFDVSDGHNAD